MAIQMGPVLRLSSCTQDNWTLSAIVLVDDDSTPDFSVDETAGASALGAGPIFTSGKYTLWRFSWVVALDDDARTCRYTVDGEPYDVTLPARGKTPRIAYCSCNGFSSASLLKKTKDQNVMWDRLWREHSGLSADGTAGDADAAPFNLLIMGGDQVYADEMLSTVPRLKAWAEKNESDRASAQFGPAMRAATMDFYTDLYRRRWGRGDSISQVLANVPTLMMWDDHDIFDGYGSYSDELNECDVHRGIFACAAEHFRAFQLHLADGEPGSFVRALPPLPFERNFSQVFQVGRLAVGVVDTRSERSNRQVMSADSWNAFYASLEDLVPIPGDTERTCDHLLMVVSLPVMYPGFNLLETALGWLPGSQELEDDLRDHWTSSPHRAERIRFIHRLLKFAAERRCRVTIISGDVHVAALGVIQSERGAAGTDESQVINQLVSSAIVHPPPPGVVQYFLSAVGGFREEIDRDIYGRMLEIPTSNQKFIAARNFMTLEPDDTGRIWARWWIDGRSQTYTKVIHPCSA